MGGMRRLDADWVGDDFGNKFWMPEGIGVPGPSPGFVESEAGDFMSPVEDALGTLDARDDLMRRQPGQAMHHPLSFALDAARAPSMMPPAAHPNSPSPDNYVMVDGQWQRRTPTPWADQSDLPQPDTTLDQIGQALEFGPGRALMAAGRGVERFGQIATTPGPEAPSMGAPADPYGPADPYQLPAMPTLGAAPTSAAEAEAQLGDAFSERSGLAQESADAGIAEQKALAERQLQAQREGVAAWDKQNAQNQERYALATQRADQETADWLKEQQVVAAEKPDPSNYFTSRSEFSQAMWVVSLFASSIAAGADQSKNVALKMLQEQVAQDVQSQREVISRRMEMGRMKGQAMDARHGRDLRRLADTEAAGWQRLNALEKMALAKAALPGPEAQRRAYAETAMVLNGEKMKIQESRLLRTREDAQRAEDKRWQAQEAAKQRAHASREAALGRELQRELAPISVGAGPGRADGLDPKDVSTLPAQTGFEVINESGQPLGPFQYHRNQQEAVSGAADTAISLATGLGNLRKALTNADGTARLFGTNEELESALVSAAGPAAKALNGGSGALTDADSARGYVQILGMDPNSWMKKVMHGRNRDEVLELLRKQIEVLPNQAATRVMTKGGVNIPKGQTVRFKMDESLLWKNPHKPDVDEMAAGAGANVKPPPRPVTSDDVSKARRLPPLPAGSATERGPKELVESFQKVTGQGDNRPLSPARQVESAEANRRAIAAWEARSTHVDKRAIAQDALARINADLKTGIRKAEAAYVEVVDAVQTGEVTTEAQIKAKASRANIALTTPEIDALLDAAAQVRKGLPRSQLSLDVERAAASKGKPRQINMQVDMPVTQPGQVK